MRQPGKNPVWVKLILLVLIVGGASYYLYDSGLIRVFVCKGKSLEFLNSLGPWAPVGFGVIQALQVIISPIPGDVTGLLGGFLFGPWLGVLLSTIGLTVGSYAAFVLARVFGRPFVERFVPKPVMERFDCLVEHRGAFVAFVLFLIPGFPKDYFCYIFGLGRMATMEFLVVSTVGRLFGTILLTLGGTYLRFHQYARFSILLGCSLVLVCAGFVFKEKLENLVLCWQTAWAGKAGPRNVPSNT
jgi:uncharacterized membrane protein YdjX (TVP38/TMEM64 family)